MKKPTKEQIDKWKVIRKKWVAALRSHKYDQGDGQLLSYEGKYCCLGVLCTIIGMVPKEKEGLIYFGISSDFAPPKAMRAVGLCGSAGEFTDISDIRRVDDSLADKNDQLNSFNDIADIIENEPYGLFKESIK